MRDKEFFQKDRFAYTLLGIEIEEIKEGYAKVSLKIEDKHLNGVNITQGGVVFTLADYALAVASNAKENTSALTTNITINYFKSTTSKDKLTAQAHEISKSKRLSTYDIEIFDQNKKIIAKAAGSVYIKSNKVK